MILTHKNPSSYWKKYLPMCMNLIQNDFKCIGDLLNTADTDIPNLYYKTFTNEL